MRVVGKILLTGLVVILLLGLEPALVLIPLQLLKALGLGWLLASLRWLSRADPSFGAPALWIGGFLALTLGLHLLGSSLRPGWPARWTLAITGGAWLTLFAAMSVIGIAHQTIWMIASKQSFLQNRNVRTMATASQVHRLAMEANWNVSELRKLIAKAPGSPSQWEEFNVVLQAEPNGTVTNVLVIDRQGQAGFTRFGKGAGRWRGSMSDLGEWVANSR